MATIERIRVDWTGFTGSPGVSTFYCVDALTMLPKLKTFFEAVKGVLPSTVTLTYESFGERLDDITGNLVGDWSTATPPAQTVGAGATTYVAAAGMVVNFLTSAIVRNRFLRGKLFLVPMLTGSTDGTPPAGTITTVQTAANTLVASQDNLKVWSRPNATLGYAGTSSLVRTANVPDKSVVLRSRRD
jgi:hypothetical protein